MSRKNTARHHHYLPQFYLRGFTKVGDKNSKLVVIAGPERKIFVTKPRNVGGVRDFNTIKSKGVKQDVLETQLAKFESQAAYSINQVTKNPDVFFNDEQHHQSIITLIALISLRNPTTRGQFEKFQVEILEKLTSLAFAEKDRYEASVEQMKKDGYEIDDSVPFEELKEFVDSKQYKISIPREWHILIELETLDNVISIIYERNWRLLISRSTDVYVTNDYPVLLYWKEPDKVSPDRRYSPGFGMKNTEVIFPLTKNIALVGDFENEPGIFPIKRSTVADINTRVINFSRKQIYAPKMNFYFLGKGGELQNDCRYLLKYYRKGI